MPWIGVYALSTTGVVVSTNVRASVHPANIELALPVKVQNVRLESVAPLETVPSSTLTFEIVNASATSVTDIMFEVSILTKSHSEYPEDPQLVLAGPYKLRAKFVLQPGYTMHYEMRLSNLSVDCECVPRVRVFSARPLN
jgi:hypothetical protein